MKTKNMFKALAMAMLMPAMLLTTACSNDDFAVNNDNTEIVNQKGFTIPVTINVTRQGDDATMRATFDNDTKKLSFSTGDKLFVKGYESVAGSFAGTLTWVSEGTFTGTITTEKEYTGTDEQLFTAAKSTGHATATLLPNGYESVNFLYIQDQGTVAKYDDEVFANYENAFALTKAAGVEQLSWEWGDYSIGTGFALSSGNTILNFTITGLAASTNVNVSLELEKYSVNKSVTTNASGTASFAIGVYGGAYNLNVLALTVGGNSIALGSKELAAGHIYNISRSVALAAVTASDLGKVIGADGKIYANADAATTAGTTGVAMITYVGSATGESAPYNHGLALAMSDANGGSSCKWKTSNSGPDHTYLATKNTFSSESGLQYNNATHNSDTYPAFKAAMSNNGTAAPKGSSAWFLPTAYQLNQMINACKNVLGTINNSSDLRDGFSTRGGTNLVVGDYWTSTEKTDGGSALRYLFGNIMWGDYYKANAELHVRAAIAF